MDALDFARSKVLNNIPNKKLQEELNSIKNSTDDLQIQSIKLIAINRYAESNIPIEYWNLKMERDFKGDPRLLTKHNEYVSDLKEAYFSGKSICFAGAHGLGKTFTTTSILKKASLKGFSCLYTTLSDIVSVLIQANSEDKFLARRELVMVDFLMIDEVDIRFFSQSDNVNELFARTFENIIRSRMQNKLPILMATNSPNIKEIFTSVFKDSLGSLMSKIKVFSVMPGNDFRKIV
jgi:DNA replication protein DnaC